MENQENLLINSSMLKMARESRLLSQKELSNKLGLTQGHYSKIESGLWQISNSYLDRLSSILNYPKSFFVEPGEIYPLPWNFYRKNKSISRKLSEQINAVINIQRKHIEKLLQSIELESNVKYMQKEKGVASTPENIAKFIREYYNLPQGPISNMTKFLEGLGIFIVNTDFGVRDFSGVSTRIQNANYVIFINSRMPGDRQRFTLAHEFGHIVMHTIPEEKMEDEANAFAAEFLMPENDIKYQLSDISLNKLAFYKLHWKVSMQAILIRALSLKKISPSKFQTIYKQMSARGYRLEEPTEFSILKEEPMLIRETINFYFDQFGYSPKELSDLFNLYENEFEYYYFPKEKENTHLKLYTND